MARLNIDRQIDLEPKRIELAKKEIEKLGYTITYQCDTRIDFTFMGHSVMFFPYSGWHSGASIKDGRGLKNLLKQIIK
jgi:hypothetical protein